MTLLLPVAAVLVCAYTALAVTGCIYLILTEDKKLKDEITVGP